MKYRSNIVYFLAIFLTIDEKNAIIKNKMKDVFDYKNSRTAVLNILSNKTNIRQERSIPRSDPAFTYDNGIRTWVGALFLDIRNSTDYFTKNKPDTVARVMRAYFSEIIKILEQNNACREIGIRGDCVYAIYSVPDKADLNDIFDDAVVINTFNNMFQKILRQNNLPTFAIGIGLGASEDLVIKAGHKGTEYNDKIWIGKAVINASNLSSNGNSEIGFPIYMDSTFYYNIKDFPIGPNEKETNSKFFTEERVNNQIAYRCNVIKIKFENWIEAGFNE